MRVYEIVSENIDEGVLDNIKTYGARAAQSIGAAAQQQGRKIAAKGLAKIGMKGAARQIAGNFDTQKKANDLFSKLQLYVSRTGGNVNQGADLRAIRDFLKTQKIDTKPYINSKSTGVIDVKNIKALLTRVAQGSYKQDQGPAAGKVTVRTPSP